MALSESDHPKIVVFGNHGQVAQSLRSFFPEAVYLGRGQVDLKRPTLLKSVLNDLKPHIIINAAAYTDVDRAEQEFARAKAINADSPSEMAAWCAQAGSSLIHFSSDYVYSGEGEQFWNEDAPGAPLNRYGQSKLLGDQAIQGSGCHHMILRTSWVFSAYGRNFVSTMLRLGSEREELRIVVDQVGSPSYALDLARAVSLLIPHKRFRESSGVFHLVNEGVTSWYLFASEIFRQARELGFEVRVKRVQPIKSDEFPSLARRPYNSRLDTAKLKKTFNLELPSWQKALESCLKTIKSS